jgi:membrane protein required for colicin V production
MTLADYVILGILLFSAIAGVLRGFLREVCSAVTWILAFWLAWHFGPLLEPHLGGLLRQPAVNVWAARAVIFLIVLLIGTAVGALVAHFMRVSLFSGIDRLLGLLLGVVRGLVIVGLVAILCHTLKLDGEPWYQKAKLVAYAEGIANGLRTLGGDEQVKRLRDMARAQAGSFGNIDFIR